MTSRLKKEPLLLVRQILFNILIFSNCDINLSFLFNTFYLKLPSAKIESMSFRFWKRIGRLFFKCFIFLSQNAALFSSKWHTSMSETPILFNIAWVGNSRSVRQRLWNWGGLTGKQASPSLAMRAKREVCIWCFLDTGAVPINLHERLEKGFTQEVMIKLGWTMCRCFPDGDLDRGNFM